METRPTSILPAIKCSTCGEEIEISSMGEHVCSTSRGNALDVGPLDVMVSNAQQHPGPSSDIPILASSPEKQSYQRTTSPTISNASPTRVRPPRVGPPRIDSAAANKPYMRGDSLRPEDQAIAGARSPRSPHGFTRPPPMRSLTSPVPQIHRPRSKSPQLSSNLDCAFPPFPTSRSSSTPKPSKTNASGQGGGSDYSTTLHAEPETYIGPRSPRLTGGADVVQRLNTIAHGPFDARRRASDEASSNKSKSPSLVQVSSPTVSEKEVVGTPSTSQYGLSRQHTAPAFVAVAPPTNSEGKPVPQRPVRPEPLDGFLAMLKAESEGMPKVAAVDMARPSSRSRTTPPAVQANGTALTVESSTRKQDVVSPLPPLSTVQALSYKNTVHTPSDSASSTSSTRSYTGSGFRSDLSPPISATSSVSMLSSTLGDLSFEQDPSIMITDLTSTSQSILLHDGSAEARKMPEPLAPHFNAPSFPMAERLELPGSPVVSVPASHGTWNHSRSPSPAPSSPLPLIPLSRGPGNPDVSIDGLNVQRPSSAKRPGTATKHHCRGCKEPIVGKSVKAADGRLTGRYHKHCFVCKTCQSPFATADFYVINNDPYCEQHYHQLNGSLCSKCNLGIEGPYLETQQGQKKFHLDCFTCHCCHKVLSDDYFEIAGTVYCEQHAFTELRRQEGLGPKRNMERRTTRLMMMGPGL
ncbi:hypothetical protein AAFC00_004794 [Neodothiora populina]|uniref:LIM zinc-binding domain-containing protein n=1 Tax=Neodothiora populina TaxID=2781224 RepID=A0ABR3P4K9_9PEZI